MLIFGKATAMKCEKKIKILAVFSNIDNANEFVWYAKHINKNCFHIKAVFLHPYMPQIIKDFEQHNIPSTHITYHGKRSFIFAFFRLLFIMLKFKPYVVHAQLFDASLLALFAAKTLGIRNRIHTRHHGNLHHIYHPHAVKYDRWVNSWSKLIICPSEQTKNIIIEKEQVLPHKVVVIKHGFDFSFFSTNKKDDLKQRYTLNQFPIIGVVSRFTEWKGIQYIIPAFKNLLHQYPEAILVMAGAEGDFTNQITHILKEIPANNFRLIRFEKDIYSLMSLFHVFVHVPVSPDAESFGQVYVEAFALAIPSIITLSGIATDDDIFAKYAEVVDYKNSKQIYQSLIKILNNYTTYINKFNEASQKIRSKYTFENKMHALEDIYLKLYKNEL